MSLLSIISGADEGAAVLCGLTAPATIIGSLDPNVPLLLRLAQQEGRELARRHDWQALRVAYTVATLAAQAQTDFPTDFDRLMPYPELWNRTRSQKYLGPVGARQWQQILSSGMSGGVPGWWCIIGGVLQITPAPTAGETLAFDYMSKNWAASAAGGAKAKFELDTDVARIPERLITLGIVWRWKKSKGFDYAEDMATYEREVEREASNDGGLGMLQLSDASLEDELGGASWAGVVTPT